MIDYHTIVKCFHVYIIPVFSLYSYIQSFLSTGKKTEGFLNIYS